MVAKEKLLLRAIKGNPCGRHPFWLMRQAGRYLPEYREVRARAGGFLDLCFNPTLAAEVTLQPVRRFATDGAILFSDILVIPHVLGQRVEYLEGEGPVLAPIRDRGAIPVPVWADVAARLGPIYETVRRVRQALPDEVALIGFAGAPWTVATYMVDGRGDRALPQVRAWLARDPAGFRALIDVLVDATLLYLRGQIDAGAETVKLFDSWAGSLEGDDFANWVIEPTSRIVAGLRASHRDIPIIGFPRGAGIQYEQYVRETGVDVIAIDQDVALAWARDVLQPMVAVQGNLDPMILVEGGPHMEARIREICGVLGGGRFIFNLGHGIVPQTPPEHVAQLSKLLHEIGAA